MNVADAAISSPRLCPPDVTVGAVRALFADEHLHVALLVEGGRLVSVIERRDLAAALSDKTPAAGLGRLAGRVASAGEDAAAVRERMLAIGQRRLAVTDDRGLLIGLLCLKASGTGFCTDDDVNARSSDGNSPPVSELPYRDGAA